MGIPSYFSYIVKKYGKIIKKYDKEIKIDNFYLDSNSIIYDVYHKIKNEEFSEDKLLDEVCKKIRYYINKVHPEKKAYISFDGVAPMAKLKQQRKRRYKSVLEKRINKVKDVWNTTNITPGTEFMIKLDKKLHKELHMYEISTSMDAGEGEHKIFDDIRRNNDVNMVYGLDADLIMLSLVNIGKTKNIYLYRETPDFIKSLDKTLNPNEEYVFAIKELKMIIEKEIPVDDYVLLCFMLGNDFMPHFPALNIRTNGLSNIMDCYKKINKTLITDGKINWRRLKTLIKELASNERIYLENEIENRREYQKYIKERIGKREILTNIPMIDTRKEETVNILGEGYRERYYEQLVGVEIDRVDKVCMNYIEGLEWNYRYYTEGCIDWCWSYKYNYPPLLEDLEKYVPYFNREILEKKECNPVTSDFQLCYVLPPECLGMVKQEIRDKLDKDWYVCSEKVNAEWSYCRYFWEANLILPEIDINALKEIT